MPIDEEFIRKELIQKMLMILFYLKYFLQTQLQILSLCKRNKRCSVKRELASLTTIKKVAIEEEWVQMRPWYYSRWTL